MPVRFMSEVCPHADAHVHERDERRDAVRLRDEHLGGRVVVGKAKDRIRGVNLGGNRRAGQP